MMIERFQIMFTANGNCEFVPRDQVFPLLSINCSLPLQKISNFALRLSTRIVIECFYLLIFYFEKSSTRVCLCHERDTKSLYYQLTLVSSLTCKGSNTTYS